MKCLECHVDLEKDYEIKMQGAPLLAFFKIKKGKTEKRVKAAICPICKRITWYTEE